MTQAVPEVDPVETDADLSYDPVEQFDGAAGDVRNPYPWLAEQRESQPIGRVTAGRAMGQKIDANAPKMPNMFTAFSREAVQEVLTDNERFSSSAHQLIMGPVMGDYTILAMDAPQHPRHRALVAKAFRQRVLERWNETLIKKTVDDLLDRIVDAGQADLVRSLTFPFPVKVISRILGLPDADWTRFQRWSIELISVAQDWERALAASAALREYFAGVVAERREEPRDDLISQLVTAEVDGNVLSDEEIFSFLRLLLPAGAETTYRSSGNLLFGLLSHPDQLDAVRDDRSLVPQVIEEALRWEPPLLFILRQATTDTTVDGVDIPAEGMVATCLGAANRDPAAVNGDPDTFDIFRDPRQHISFGTGPHMCLGMHLARLETRALLDGVLDRLPNLRLDPNAEDPHIHGLTFRAPTALPVLFDPA
jgi:cytochrome P450